ncbi:AMIN domain-containing protein [Maridesulfovibrio sp. FT414]|uniref:AMIN domain-containing protein n=1 Tax=Maridesulfovibrio sp. FT414 TaxID=2979469 RepID=UPI003D80445A
MKMNIRPTTVLLLIILLVVGVNAGLYHFGMFDSFLAKMEGKTDPVSGEGPVVRKEVSNLVLPLKSSQEEGQDKTAEELNESEIGSGYSGAEQDAGARNETSVAEAVTGSAEVSATAEAQAPVEVATTAEAPAPAKTAPVETAKKVASKPAPAKKSVASAGGIVGPLDVRCAAGEISLRLPLTAPAGRVKWFNLDNPRRLVVDLLGKWDCKGPSLYKLKDCGVEKIVIGEHPDKLRLVLYFGNTGIPGRLSSEVKKNKKELLIAVKF